MLRRRNPLHLLRHLSPSTHTPHRFYTDVKMKWKKDPFYDTLDTVNRATHLRPLTSLATLISAAPSSSIPISAVSKSARPLEIHGRVASFLRLYPAVFHEFPGPDYNLPWFRLTPEASQLQARAASLYNTHRSAIVDRLLKLLLMSKDRRLPAKVVRGMLWYLGLPDDFLHNPEENSNNRVRILDIDGEQWVAAVPNGDIPLSTLQRGAMRYSGSPSPPEAIAFPLFPSRGLRLKHKIEQWLSEFQCLPYVSPYEDSSGMDPGSDVAEKRAAGVLHELLCLFVDYSAERRKLLCLKKHLRLSQKFHKVFERHPHVFYLQLKNKTCTVVLKEAYCAGLETVVERHPMLEVRKRYVRLMNKSEEIRRRRRREGRLRTEAADPSSDSNVHCDGKVEKSESLGEEASGYYRFSLAFG